MSGGCGQAKRTRPGVGPTEVARAPSLLEEIPRFMQLEREVEEEFRPAMRESLRAKIVKEAKALSGSAPECTDCHRRMESRGRSTATFLCRFGEVAVDSNSHRCKSCKKTRNILHERLGVEIGRVCGAFARLIALLGVIVSYEQAAMLGFIFFGVQVSTMTVWREVQRLGEAAEQYTEAQAKYHGSPHAATETVSDAPKAVVLGVDGGALGMQVRSKRRRQPEDGSRLPPLPPVEDGHFREVKTGVLLLPEERVESSPSRHTVIRRALVTCLGNADQVFDRLWAKLHELQWYGPQTVVVIVGDGAAWIWNRAAMFTNRCEILDFWHAIEHAWEVARLCFGPESETARCWVDNITVQLRAGKIEALIAELHKLTTSNAQQKEALDGLIRYYTENASRMRYDEYLRLGYGIGSGAVESAHKQVVHSRLRQAGMRWSEAGARRLLALRAFLLNGNWATLDRLAKKAA